MKRQIGQQVANYNLTAFCSKEDLRTKLGEMQFRQISQHDDTMSEESSGTVEIVSAYKKRLKPGQAHFTRCYPLAAALTKDKLSTKSPFKGDATRSQRQHIESSIITQA